MKRPFNDNITVLVADDEVGIAQAFSRALALWFRAAGIATALNGLSARIRDTSPDIVLLDLSFGKKSSIKALPRLRKEHPAVGFIMFSGHGDPILVEAALDSGARAFVAKVADMDEIATAIDEVLAGRTFVSPAIYAPAHEASDARPGRLPPTDLRPTPRELDVLTCLRNGFTIAKAAEQLGIAVKTVDEHLHNLRERTGIANRMLLIQWAEPFMLPGERPANPRRK